ncbi:hypothetical protein V7S76_08815 [Aquirufa sp. ROCK2-A2]
MKNSSKLILFFFTGLLSLLISEVKAYSHREANLDSNAILLKEVVILIDPSKTPSSEIPKKVSSISGGPLQLWMGILMNDPTLFQKEIRTISFYTKKSNTKVFELEFYTLGADSLHEKKLHSDHFEFSLFKKGWNEFQEKYAERVSIMFKISTYP